MAFWKTDKKGLQAHPATVVGVPSDNQVLNDFKATNVAAPESRASRDVPIDRRLLRVKRLRRSIAMMEDTPKRARLVSEEAAHMKALEDAHRVYLVLRELEE